MNKSELIKKMTKNTKLTQKECCLCLDAFIHVLKDTLICGEPVVLNGFGKFSAKFRSEKKGINPLTKTFTTYPAKFVPFFNPSKAFKQKFL